MTAQPPPARADSDSYRIALVCLGNICRSPMADVVLEERLRAGGLADRVEVRSAGTAGWHIGKTMDARAAELLTAEGYDPSRHRAAQATVDWLDDFDLVLAMDAANLADLQDLDTSRTGADRLMLFGEFDPVTPGAEVPDPYYGGDEGFREVLAMVERTSDNLVIGLTELLATQQDRPTGGTP